MVPNDKDVLIGSKCLSCNRPLGGFASPHAPKGLDEWYTGAGGLGGPKDRVVEVRGGTSGSEETKEGSSGGGGRSKSSAGIGSSRSPGQTQPVMTPGKILPLGSASSSSEGSGNVPRKGPQGPLLFERRQNSDGAEGSGLQGRVLRGGGGSATSEPKVSVSKVSRRVFIWSKAWGLLQRCPE